MNEFNLSQLKFYRSQCLLRMKPYQDKGYSNLDQKERKEYKHYHDVFEELDLKIFKAENPPKYSIIKKIRGIDDDNSYPQLPF